VRLTWEVSGGDRHLNFYEVRDNLAVGADTTHLGRQIQQQNQSPAGPLPLDRHCHVRTLRYANDRLKLARSKTRKCYTANHCPNDEAYHHRPGCGKIFRSAEPIEILVSEAVLYRLDSPDFLKALGAQANDHELKDVIDQQRADETRRDAIRTAYADGQIGLQDLIFIKRWFVDYGGR
jgi:hypothetical protein